MAGPHNGAVIMERSGASFISYITQQYSSSGYVSTDWSKKKLTAVLFTINENWI